MKIAAAQISCGSGEVGANLSKIREFVSRAKEQWDVEFNDTPSLLLSKTTLPAKPKVLVLPGR